jgi:hypothetical protein
MSMDIYMLYLYMYVRIYVYLYIYEFRHVMYVCIVLAFLAPKRFYDFQSYA